MLSVTRSRSEKAELGFFLGIFFFLLFAGRVMLLQDSDTFWHIAAGHQVLDTGRFITTDPFTFTFQGEEWVAYEWLSECLLAVIDDVAGFDGLVLATAALLAWFFMPGSEAGWYVEGCTGSWRSCFSRWLSQ
jgi:hypothetical protein